VCCNPKVFVVVAVMGFLSVISLILGRRVTEKSPKKWWESLVGLVFRISMALGLDYLLINIEDDCLLKNLQLVLANLGILGTTLSGTLRMFMFQITSMDKFDDVPEIRDIRQRARRVGFVARTTPSQIKQRDMVRTYGFPP
jgi:hypothetical protein